MAPTELERYLNLHRKSFGRGRIENLLSAAVVRMYIVDKIAKIPIAISFLLAGMVENAHILTAALRFSIRPRRLIHTENR